MYGTWVYASHLSAIFSNSQSELARTTCATLARPHQAHLFSFPLHVSPQPLQPLTALARRRVFRRAKLLEKTTILINYAAEFTHIASGTIHCKWNMSQNNTATAQLRQELKHLGVCTSLLPLDCSIPTCSLRHFRTFEACRCYYPPLRVLNRTLSPSDEGDKP